MELDGAAVARNGNGVEGASSKAPRATPSRSRPKPDTAAVAARNHRPQTNEEAAEAAAAAGAAVAADAAAVAATRGQ